MGQLHHLKDWKEFGSSDLVSEEDDKFNVFYSPGNKIQRARTGNKFIGFGPCEGVQVKLIHKKTSNIST